MSAIIAIYHFLIHPLAIPIWGLLSAVAVHLFNVWKESSKNKIEERKVDVEENKTDRSNDREDFQVIKDSLYAELNRMKEVQADTSRQLQESNEETQKCEQRYFELATQYRELLKYCATLARKVRILETKVQDHVSEENNNKNDETRTNSETTRGSGD